MLKTPAGDVFPEGDVPAHFDSSYLARASYIHMDDDKMIGKNAMVTIEVWTNDQTGDPEPFLVVNLEDGRMPKAKVSLMVVEDVKVPATVASDSAPTHPRCRCVPEPHYPDWGGMMVGPVESDPAGAGAWVVAAAVVGWLTIFWVLLSRR